MIAVLGYVTFINTAAVASWGQRATFSEADTQMDSLQWSGMYFGNAAVAAVGSCEPGSR